MDTFQAVVNINYVSAIITRAVNTVMESDIATKMVRTSYWEGVPFRLFDEEDREISLSQDGIFLVKAGSASLTLGAMTEQGDYHIKLDVGTDEYLSQQFFDTMEELLIAIGRSIERDYAHAPIIEDPKIYRGETTTLGQLLKEKLSKV